MALLDDAGGADDDVGVWVLPATAAQRRVKWCRLSPGLHSQTVYHALAIRPFRYFSA